MSLVLKTALEDFKGTSYKLLKNRKNFLSRIEIFPFLFFLYPLVIFVAIYTWDSWHANVSAVLSNQSAYCPLQNESSDLLYSSFRLSFFDFASQLPKGIPRLYPLLAVENEILYPELESSNVNVIVFASFGASIILNIIVFLSNVWFTGIRAWSRYYTVDDLSSATHIMVATPGKKTVLAPLQSSHVVIDKETNLPIIDPADLPLAFQNKTKEFKSVILFQATYLVVPVNSKSPQLLKDISSLFTSSSCEIIKSSKINKIENEKDEEEIVSLISEEKKERFGLALVSFPHPICCDINYYKETMKGNLDRKEIEARTLVYGDNKYDIPIPTFMELFREHALSPFFVFQIGCLILWLLDEYWQYTLFTLFTLIMFEAQLVYKRLKDMSMIRNMRQPAMPVTVYRRSAWWWISSDQLVPGDIFSFNFNQTQSPDSSYPRWDPYLPLPTPQANQSSALEEDALAVVPCDALVLHGSFIMNEAALTGESITSLKSPLVDFDENDISSSNNSPLKKRLDIEMNHKHSILFSGTSLLSESVSGSQTSSIQNNLPINCLKTNSQSSICLCLRTGLERTDGKLVRSILFSSERITVASLDASLFLLVLLTVSILASGYVLYNSWGLPHRNHFKLLLHCIMIVTSVVPPEFPITMSLTVTVSLASLVRKHIYCTEPFRIPLGGKLDLCCFDKTGTLTSSNLDLIDLINDDGISIIANPKSENKKIIKNEEEEDNKKNKDSQNDETLIIPFGAALVSAGCHSLALINSTVTKPNKDPKQPPIRKRIQKVVGDPMEKSIHRTLKLFELTTGQTNKVTIHGGSDNRENEKTDKSFRDRMLEVLEEEEMKRIQKAEEGLSDENLNNNNNNNNGCLHKKNSNLSNRKYKFRIQKPKEFELTDLFKFDSDDLLIGDLSLEVIKRFPFSSIEQRMSCVIKTSKGLLNQQQMNKMLNNPSCSSFEGSFYFMVMKGAAERVQQYLSVVPEWYSDELMNLTNRGFRVLAMAYKRIEIKNNKDIININTKSRSELEKDLYFGGFMVLGCPIKRDTTKMIKEIKDTGHGVMMITGDDLRTAVQVARQVQILNSDDEILLFAEDKNEEVQLSFKDQKSNTNFKIIVNYLTDSSKFNEISLSNESWANSTSMIRKKRIKNSFCLKGSDLQRIPDWVLKRMLPFVKVFARVSPKDKERILSLLKSSGVTTLMCGDGTNDVGALKVADIGVSLLNYEIERMDDIRTKGLEVMAEVTKLDESEEAIELRRSKLNLSEDSKHQLIQLDLQFAAMAKLTSCLPKSLAQSALIGLKNSILAAEKRLSESDSKNRETGIKKIEPVVSPFEMLKTQMNEMSDGSDFGVPVLKLGDASMASSFTYRGSSISCVTTLITLGKGTLASVMMMYKLMALNSLATAFSLSYLTLYGVKFGDFQSTAESIFISILFMAVSNAKAAPKLVAHRTCEKIFSSPILTSVILQSMVQISTITGGLLLARQYIDPETITAEGPFEPNLINTVVYLISASTHVSSFIGNYCGLPALAPMRENYVLRNGILIFIGFLLLLCSEAIPMLNAKFSLVQFPNVMFRYAVLGLIFTNFSLSYLINKYVKQYSIE